MHNLLIICGPTATGKTSLAVEIAKKYNGEIVSADSRQVYREMDIGTGKDIKTSEKLKVKSVKLENKELQIGFREKDGIPVWLVDIVSPEYRFNGGEYKKLANIVISDIQKRGKLPIVVGGTGLYIKSLMEPRSQISIPLNAALRQELNGLTVEKLQTRLRKLDENKFAVMNHSDQQNPRRLIRAIEIVEHNASVILGTNEERTPESDSGQARMTKKMLIGLTAEKDFLFQKINERIRERFQTGIIEEIKSLLAHGYNWDLASMSATGYLPWKSYFEGKKTAEEVLEDWQKAEHDYARRQLTWFKKMASIRWFDIQKENFKTQVFAEIKAWYT